MTYLKNLLNSILDYFKPIFDTKDLQNRLVTLEKENMEIKMLNKKLQTKIDSLKQEDKEEEYWNNKWPQSPIVYNAQDEQERDVRNLIFSKSYILERVAGKWRGLEPEEIAYKALCWVIDNVKYTGDIETHKEAEFWQLPEETYATKRGDCEDGAILITSLMRIAGVPAYKVKICAGWVKSGESQGGHAYTIFLRDDQTWCVLDWCYWANKKPIKERKQQKEESNYLEIWFTFNDQYSFSQHNTNVGDVFNG